MDIHHKVDATPDDVQKAHLSDLEAQEKFGVKYLKYWFNPHAKTICCLVHAPDPESARQVHLEAHGLEADKIIEVRTKWSRHSSAVAWTPARAHDHHEGAPTAPFAILFTDIAGSTSMTQRLGDDRR
jgi:hypothetical protein